MQFENTLKTNSEKSGQRYADANQRASLQQEFVNFDLFFNMIYFQFITAICAITLIICLRNSSQTSESCQEAQVSNGDNRSKGLNYFLEYVINNYYLLGFAVVYFGIKWLASPYLNKFFIKSITGLQPIDPKQDALTEQEALNMLEAIDKVPLKKMIKIMVGFNLQVSVIGFVTFLKTINFKNMQAPNLEAAIAYNSFIDRIMFQTTVSLPTILFSIVSFVWDLKRNQITHDRKDKTVQILNSLSKRLYDGKKEVQLKKNSVSMLEWMAIITTGSLRDFLNMPTYIQINLHESSNSQSLHDYIILANVLKRNLPWLDIFSVDDQGNFVGFIDPNPKKNFDKNAQPSIDALLGDLDAIYKHYKEIEKIIKQFKKKEINGFKIVECFLDIKTSFNELYRIAVPSAYHAILTENQVAIAADATISSDDFKKIADRIILSSVKKVANSDSDGDESPSVNLYQQTAPAWFFCTESNDCNGTKPSKKKISPSSSTEILKPVKKEPETNFNLTWEGVTYDCGKNDGIKLLYVDGHMSKPIAVGIFRVKPTQFDESGKLAEFKRVFKDTDFIGGIHGDCIKRFDQDRQADIKKKKMLNCVAGDDSNFEIPCTLHQTSNVRVFAIADAQMAAVNIDGIDCQLKIYDFSAVDNNHHPSDKDPGLSNTKCKLNETPLQEYLQQTCKILQAPNNLRLASK